MAAQAADKQNDELMTDLAGLFKMFSDPTRVKILNILLDGEKCVGDVAAQMNMSAAAVSHHLRMLRQGNLVIDHRQGKEVFYSLADDHVVSILSLGMEHVTE
ncbi:MAG: transcriptional regulator [Coriobacteriia bacterium]|nr:MAG: transcriptional regulator [Coriobacteriia bacterium]HJI99686.1 metalloregulator ArsR/SmtB family transcription factor [Coriobacteriaceae bacterium]